MAKNSFLFSLCLVVCLFSLTGCLLDDPQDGTIKSITVSPDRIGKTDSTGLVTVTVKLGIPLGKVNKDKSYPFVKDGSTDKRGRDQGQGPQEKDGDTLIYQIQKSWLTELPVGSHNVGFVLETDTSILTVNDKSMGNFAVEN